VDRLLWALGDFDWLVLTSSTGVEFFGARMRFLSLRLPWKGNPRVAAVGRQTARALSDLGVNVDFVPSVYATSVLGEELPAKEGASVLLLRADVADGGLPRRLAERGFKVEEGAIYRTVSAGRESPEIRDADMIVFASPSAVRSFCESRTEEELWSLKKLKVVCIGPVTEAAARERGFLDTTKPGSYTLDAVVSEVARLSRTNG
jgi:uroporphyrinogen-III synthase